MSDAGGNGDTALGQDLGEETPDSGAQDIQDMADLGNPDTGTIDLGTTDMGTSISIIAGDPVNPINCMEVCVSMGLVCDNQYDWIIGIGGGNFVYDGCRFIESCDFTPELNQDCFGEVRMLSEYSCACR